MANKQWQPIVTQAYGPFVPSKPSSGTQATAVAASDTRNCRIRANVNNAPPPGRFSQSALMFRAIS